uniref:Uncharacterized protein n=1 Tax=Arundo donax TaxID=35708 RepID=A0A0A9B752_ARUDO
MNLKLLRVFKPVQDGTSIGSRYYFLAITCLLHSRCCHIESCSQEHTEKQPKDTSFCTNIVGQMVAGSLKVPPFSKEQCENYVYG